VDVFRLLMQNMETLFVLILISSRLKMSPGYGKPFLVEVPNGSILRRVVLTKKTEKLPVLLERQRETIGF
jgi:hypothetical protein